MWRYHRLDRVYGCPNQIPVDGLQIGLPAKHDVRRVFGFVQAPVIGFLDLFQDGAVPLSEFIQFAMQKRRIPTVRQSLC